MSEDQPAWMQSYGQDREGVRKVLLEAIERLQELGVTPLDGEVAAALEGMVTSVYTAGWLAGNWARREP